MEDQGVWVVREELGGGMGQFPARLLISVTIYRYV